MQQEPSARRMNTRALAIHKESIKAAAGRDLWDEVRRGLWDLILLSREMLSSDPFISLTNSSAFIEGTGLIALD